jgi:hypothetical protein
MKEKEKWWWLLPLYHICLSRSKISHFLKSSTLVVQF